jgi:hypothetical protein
MTLDQVEGYLGTDLFPVLIGHGCAPIVKSTPHRLFWQLGAHGALTFLQSGHCHPF